MKRLISFVLFLVFAATLGIEAVDGNRAQYVGGTIATVSEKAEGDLVTNLEKQLIFQSKGAAILIPYDSIEGLEYGQKAGRRVAVAVLVNPVALFSKKRKHFLTINFKDEQGKNQAVVFELGKDIARKTLTIVEARSGKKIEYQDEEARKAGRG